MTRRSFRGTRPARGGVVGQGRVNLGGWELEPRLVLSSYVANAPAFQLVTPNPGTNATESILPQGIPQGDTTTNSDVNNGLMHPVEIKGYSAATIYPQPAPSGVSGNFTNFAQNELFSSGTTTKQQLISVTANAKLTGTISDLNPPESGDQSEYVEDSSGSGNSKSINWNFVNEGNASQPWTSGEMITQDLTFYYVPPPSSGPVYARPGSPNGSQIAFQSGATGVSVQSNSPSAGDLTISVPNPGTSPTITTYPGFFYSTRPLLLHISNSFSEPSNITGESISYDVVNAGDPDPYGDGVTNATVSDSSQVYFHVDESVSPLAGPSYAPVFSSNLDSGYSQTGAWTTTSIGSFPGYKGVYAYAAPSGSSANTATATWQVSGLAPGPQEVQVTWGAGSNRADNATYSIYDGTTLVGTAQVNQKQTPLGQLYNAPGDNTTLTNPPAQNPLVPFQSLGVYNITSGTLKVVLGNGNNADGYVIANAIRVAPPQPDSFIIDNQDTNVGTTGSWTSTSLIDRYNGGFGGEYVYAASSGGSASTSTTTWQTPGLNPGQYDVGVTWVAGSNRASNAMYQVYDGSALIGSVVVNQKVTPTGPTFDGVQFQDLGTFRTNSGTIRVVLGNGNNANGYVIADAVRVSEALIDNQDPGYYQSGTWSNNSGSGGYNNDYNYASAYTVPGTDASATWAAQNLMYGGLYEVDVSWVAGAGQATNASYQIYDGSTLLSTVTVNQQSSPSGQTYGGVPFYSLGNYTFNNGALRVVLGNRTNGQVVADAIRVAYV